jgi:hypothetical protein
VKPDALTGTWASALFEAVPGVPASVGDACARPESTVTASAQRNGGGEYARKN